MYLFSCCVFALTCVSQVNDSKENHPRCQRNAQKEQCLELLPGQSILQILQKGVSLKQCKYTCKHTHAPLIHKRFQTLSQRSWIPGANLMTRKSSLSWPEFMDLSWERWSEISVKEQQLKTRGKPVLPAAAMCSLVLMGWKPTNGICMDSTKPTI